MRNGTTANRIPSPRAKLIASREACYLCRLSQSRRFPVLVDAPQLDVSSDMLFETDVLKDSLSMARQGRQAIC